MPNCCAAAAVAVVVAAVAVAVAVAVADELVALRKFSSTVHADQLSAHYAAAKTARSAEAEARRTSPC